MPSLVTDEAGQAGPNVPDVASYPLSEKGQFLTTSTSKPPFSAKENENIGSTKSASSGFVTHLTNGLTDGVDGHGNLDNSAGCLDHEERDKRNHSSEGKGTQILTNGCTSNGYKEETSPSDRIESQASDNFDKEGRLTSNSGVYELNTDKVPPTSTENDDDSIRLPSLNTSGKSPNVAASSHEGMFLQVPGSTYRSSSPPILSNHTSAQRNTRSSTIPIAEAPFSSLNGRLTNRHTLDTGIAPGIGITKSSTSPSQLEETGSLAGRLSPSSPARSRASMVLTRRFTRSINSDAQLDDTTHDEDVSGWTDHVRSKRASKRRRKDEDDDDRVVVGTKVDQNHVNWVTAYNMLTGIRFTVSRTNAKLDRELTDADFAEKTKFSFDITGNELTPSAKYDFKFKDYAPWIFRRLRATFHLDPADYLMSLTSKYILSELGSPGKSGSFFYFSRDYKYIIKTIHHGEHRFLRHILKKYYNHVQQNPNTLLSQFYGLHRVKIPYGRKIHFVVMNNLFPPHRDIHRTFDLKGSTIGRDLKEEDLEENPRATLKDLNWLRRNMRLELGPTKRQAFLRQIEKDVTLLQELEIMDYSLLLGIHDLGKGNEENLRDKTLQVFQPGGENTNKHQDPKSIYRSPSKADNEIKAKELRHMIKNQRPVRMDQTLDRMPDELLPERRHFYFYSDDGGFRATHEDDSPSNEIYYLGVIDCLTHYNFLKRMEHFLKGLTNDETQISAIPPDKYGERFIKFITGSTKPRDITGLKGEFLEQSNGGIIRPEVPRTSTEEVMQRAHHQAELSGKKGVPEHEIPDVHLSAVKSSSTEPGSERILPVVEKAVDPSSRKKRISQEQSLKGPVTVEGPPTPPKDTPETERLPATVSTGVRPPTPPSEEIPKANSWRHNASSPMQLS